MGKKEKTKTWYKKKLDKVFSQYIREKAEKDGIILCYICGKRLTMSTAQCMHYVGRANLSTRWDEENCRAGCSSCNVFKNGNYPEFTNRLLEDIGTKKLKRLIEKGREVRPWTIEDIKNEIKKYE